MVNSSIDVLCINGGGAVSAPCAMDRNLVTTKYPSTSQTNISVCVEWI